MRRTVGRWIGVAWLAAFAAGCGGPPFVLDLGDASLEAGSAGDDASATNPPSDATAGDVASDGTVDRRDGESEKGDGGGEADATVDAGRGGGADAGVADAGGGLDAGPTEGGAAEGGAMDAGPLDAGPADAAPADAGCSVSCGPLCCTANMKCCATGSGSATTYKCIAQNALCL